MPYSREATVRDAINVLKNIRADDRREVEGLGHKLTYLPLYIAASDHTVAFLDDDETIGGVAGIQPDPTSKDVGLIWMVCTDDLVKKPHTFVRGAKRWLAEHEQEYKLLWNLADSRNVFHHKLLKMLGFKALREVNTGPYFLPYLEIVKLCAYPSCHSWG